MKRTFLALAFLAVLSAQSYAQRAVQIVYDNNRAFIHFVGEAAFCETKIGVVNGREFRIDCINFLPINIPENGIIEGDVTYFKCGSMSCLWEGEGTSAGQKSFYFEVPKRVLKAIREKQSK